VIVGVGIDVVDIGRFTARLAATPRLGERLFTAEELGLRPESMAARFAAKEALAKALGAPVGLRWTDATVVRAADGRPSLRITGTVQARAELLGVTALHVSLSHDAGIASAVVVAERVAPADPAVAQVAPLAEHVAPADPAADQVTPLADDEHGPAGQEG
jgi:holo-[acyl-carrier protein] synthase